MSDIRAPYGRQERAGTSLFPSPDGMRGRLQPYDGETYYGLSPVKPSPYRWLVADYLFVGGLAGSCQVLAVVADFTGGNRARHVVRAGRYLAVAGVLVSPLLLIGDLHYPRRWYNMLRIFRATSPMSIGAWTLTAFGTLSSLTALGQLCEDRYGSVWGRRLARVCGLPAGWTGAMMSVYTGSLLAATSTPLWASVYRLLPALFGTSAASTASAALSLTMEATAASEEEHRRLEKFALISTAAELALASATQKQWRDQGLDGPLRRQPTAAAFRLGAVGLGMIVPLAVHGYQALTGRRSRAASTVAAVSALIGGFCLRASILKAGNESARRPQDYFRMTQPARLPTLADAVGRPSLTRP